MLGCPPASRANPRKGQRVPCGQSTAGSLQPWAQKQGLALRYRDVNITGSEGLVRLLRACREQAHRITGLGLRARRERSGLHPLLQEAGWRGDRGFLHRVIGHCSHCHRAGHVVERRNPCSSAGGAMPAGGEAPHDDTQAFVAEGRRGRWLGEDWSIHVTAQGSNRTASRGLWGIPALQAG